MRLNSHPSNHLKFNHKSSTKGIANGINELSKVPQLDVSIKFQFVYISFIADSWFCLHGTNINIS